MDFYPIGVFSNLFTNVKCPLLLARTALLVFSLLIGSLKVTNPPLRVWIDSAGMPETKCQGFDFFIKIIQKLNNGKHFRHRALYFVILICWYKQAYK